MAQVGWIYEKSRCVGCRACTVACKMENNTPTSLNFRWVVEQESGEYPSPKVTFTSMACFHCEAPACRAACPVDAISKDPETGIVLIDAAACTGCRYCMAACPYGAPQLDAATGKVRKCTYCIQRTSEGLAPACVLTCVGGALRAATDVGWGGTPPDGFAPVTLTAPAIKFEE